MILRSEGYSAKGSCINGIESVRKNSQDDARFERKTASNGKFFFNLTATNGQTVGSSQMYADESGRDNGIASVKTNAPGAAVDDQTACSGPSPQALERSGLHPTGRMHRSHPPPPPSPPRFTPPPH